MNKKVAFQDLGLIDYKKCWDYQEALFAEILAVKSANRKENKTARSEEHTSELQSQAYLVCRLLLEKKKKHKHCRTCKET